MRNPIEPTFIPGHACAGFRLALLAAAVAVASPTVAQDVPALSIDDVRVLEGHSGTRTALLTVTLSGPSALTVTVGYRTVDATAIAAVDYEAAAGTLTIADDGDVRLDKGTTTATVRIPVLGDATPEGDETFFVDLVDPSNATLGKARGVVTIADDETSGDTPLVGAWATSREGMAAPTSMASNGSLLVAVGASGDVFTSPDAAAWTKRSNPDPYARQLNAVVWSGTQFVAVGQRAAATPHPVVLTSSDGSTWTLRDPAVDRSLLGLAFAAGRYVACGNAGRVATSLDGVTWTASPAVTSDALNAVAYGNGRLVAVGARTVIASDDLGATWTVQPAVPPEIAGSLNGIAWDDAHGVFVVVAGDLTTTATGRVVMTSPDGTTWTVQAHVGMPMRRVTLVDLGLLAVGTGTAGTTDTQASLSTDGGATWLPLPLAALPGPGVAWSLRAAAQLAPGGAIGVTGARGSAFRMEGAVLVDDTPAAARTLLSVAHDGTRFCAVGMNGAVAVSSDGVAWTNVETVPDPALYWGWSSVVWAEGRFVAVGYREAVMSSPDCVNWTLRHADGATSPSDPVTAYYLDVAFAADRGLYVAVGDDATDPSAVVPRIDVSSDLEHWTPVSLPVAPGSAPTVVTVAYGNGRFVTAPRASATTGRKPA